MPDSSGFENFFNANSYVIIGASEKPGPGKVASEMMLNKFEGKVYLVNPKGGEMFGQPVYRFVNEIPDPVDAAIIVTSARHVVATMQDCADKGIKSAVIIAGGFAEVSEEGRDLQLQVQKIGEKANMRLVGPNCIGLFYPRRGIDMWFLPDTKVLRPGVGQISLFSQSGALSAAIMNELSNLQNGNWISKFISYGNAIDLADKHALEYLGSDDETGQIWAYIEGFKYGRDFMKAARKVSTKKPVVVLKANRTATGARASASHSASLASNDAVGDYLMRQSGIIRVDGWADQFDVGRALIQTKPPKGNRIAIVTDGGGMGVMASDEIGLWGLELATLTEETVARFKQDMPPFYIVGGVTDLTGSANTDDFVYSLDLVLKDPNVDAVILINLPCVPNMEVPEFVEKITANFGIRDGKDNRPDKPILTVAMGGVDDSELIEGLENGGLTVYPTPARVVKAMYKLVKYGEFLQREAEVQEQEPTPFEQDPEILGIIEKAKSEGRHVILENEARQIFAKIGLPVPKTALVKSAADARSFQEEVGTKVVMKLVSPEVIHKSDEGAVFVGIKTPEEVEETYNHLYTKFKDRSFQGVLMSQYIDDGLEIMIGMNTDPTFGKIVVAGIGGVLVEVLQDVTFNMCPTTVSDAKKMIHDLKNQKLIAGYRGQAGVDVEKFAEMIVAISRLAATYEDIAEMDLNPIIVNHEGTWVLDARMLLKQD